MKYSALYSRIKNNIKMYFSNKIKQDKITHNSEFCVGDVQVNL